MLVKGKLDYYSGDDKQKFLGSFSIDNPPVKITNIETEAASDDKIYQFMLKRSKSFFILMLVSQFILLVTVKFWLSDFHFILSPEDVNTYVYNKRSVSLPVVLRF